MERYSLWCINFHMQRMNINKIISRYYIDCFFLLFANSVISFTNILQLNCLP
ncbi:hypothetical protein HMPREF9543_01101 [Escherichia coli MS 146-1]|nr:hypothetical protein HMPREF9543_01101 [Escherichia coli MS 146-1]